MGARYDRSEKAEMDLNGKRLIRLPVDDSRQNYLAGFWRWVELLAANDYRAAIEALYWPEPTSWTPDTLRQRVTTFFGGDAPWSVVIPNERLVSAIDAAAEFLPRNNEHMGWFLAQIPLTTCPTDPKSDEIPLMGLACSFFVRERAGALVMEHEIFHL
jgi:hypothetical protein